jgi:putative Ca2+/H+ antiporter (TMEM165/GDT1 family)
VYYVTAGVVIGHGMCTAGAVMGGRMLATKISVRTGKEAHILEGTVLRIENSFFTLF